jgi:protein gp37
MTENTKIPWADSTFNPWIGCAPIHRACSNCYARSFAKRMGLDVFGKERPRKITKDWFGPVRWDKQASKNDCRRSVFLMSLGDFFDPHPDLREPRRRVFELIEQTPHLVWLILTKRVRLVEGMVRAANYTRWPSNARLGITVGTQEDADEDMPELANMRVLYGCKTFVSYEPLLEDIDVQHHLHGLWTPSWGICGAESAPGRRPGKRPMDLDWARSLRDQHVAADVPFLLKQAVIAGKLVELPALDGQVWDQRPEW